MLPIISIYNLKYVLIYVYLNTLNYHPCKCMIYKHIYDIHIFILYSYSICICIFRVYIYIHIHDTYSICIYIYTTYIMYMYIYIYIEIVQWIWSWELVKRLFSQLTLVEAIFKRIYSHWKKRMWLLKILFDVRCL